MTYFSHVTAAQRCATGRPFFHPTTIGQRIEHTLALTGPLHYALDVGCCIGQSTTILLPIASNVVGMDVSKDMLRETPRTPRVRCVRAEAERLPFASDSFDLLTAGLAFYLVRPHPFPGRDTAGTAHGWLVGDLQQRVSGRDARKP